LTHKELYSQIIPPYGAVFYWDKGVDMDITTLVPEIDIFRTKLSSKRLWLIADLHQDASTFREEAFEKAKKKIGNDPVIGLGDSLDYAFFNNIRTQLERQATLDGKIPREEIKQRVGIEAMLRVDKILDSLNWLAMAEGNHDRRASKATGDNFLKYACFKRHIRFSEGQMLLYLEIGKKNNGAPRIFKILLTHGSRGGRRQGSPLNELEDIWSGWSGLDVVVIGHHHKFVHSEVSRGVAANPPYVETTHLIAVPSFLGFETYAQRKGYRPPTNGIVKLEFTPTTGKIKVEYVPVN